MRKDLKEYLLDYGGVLILDSFVAQSSCEMLIGLGHDRLSADSLRGGQRAAAAMSLIQSAKPNGHAPHAYLKDVLTRLPTHINSRIEVNRPGF